MLQNILNTCLSILQRVQLIYNVVVGLATFAQAQQILSNLFNLQISVAQTNATLNDPTNGLAQINTNVLAIITDLTADFDALSLQISGISDQITAGVPVSSIGGSGTNDIANAVWSYPIPTEGTFASTCLANAHYFSLYQSNQQMAIDSTGGGLSYYRLTGNWNVPAQADPDFNTPLPLDFFQIISADTTVLDFVNRIYPGTFSALGNGLPALPDPGSNTFWWVVWLPDPAFDVLKTAVLGGGASVVTPPAWPGLANVTLGAPVAIAEGVTITTPMHGIIVNLTSIPANRGSYLFDDKNSYLNLGAIVFFSDNNDEEHPQNFGFTSAVYLVRTMGIAAGVKVRAIPGLAGTITPFLIS